MSQLLAACAEAGLLPDCIIRSGIRLLCRQRLRGLEREFAPDPGAAMRRFLARLDAAPIADSPGRANEQHYEVPADFFRIVLGPQLKYSSCYFSAPDSTLAEAEEAALERTAANGMLEDGQDVLELGCGWGSLTMWIARRHPRSRITAVSNSASQRRFIMDRVREQGLDNVSVLTADMNSFEAPGAYDRVVSVEMFEHMRNQRALLTRVHRWLRPGGRLFIHVFCHRDFPYTFETGGSGDWMARHFFTGGLMPHRNLVPALSEGLFSEEACEHWSGAHYARTAEAWLGNLDAGRGQALAALRQGLPGAEARRALRRWRIFLLACCELFAYRGAAEWGVVHHRLVRC